MFHLKLSKSTNNEQLQLNMERRTSRRLMMGAEAAGQLAGFVTKSPFSPLLL